MPTPPLFKFYIKKNATTFIYVGDDGMITETSDLAIGLANPLKYSPTNWNDIAIGYARSQSLHGIFTKLTGEYQLVGDGAKIARYLSITYGYTAKAIFLVRTRQNVAWIYQDWLESDISFEKPKIDKTSVGIQLFEEGLAQDIKQSLNTTYEIPFDLDAITVYFAGTRVKSKYNFKYSKNESRLVWPTARGISNGYYFKILSTNQNNEGFKAVVTAQNGEPFELGDYSTPIFFTEEAYSKYEIKNIDTDPLEISNFFHGVIDPTLNIEVKWRYEGGVITPTARFEMWALIVKQDRTFTPVLLYSGAPILMTPGVEYTETIPSYSSSLPNLNNGESITLSAGIFVGAASAIPNGFFYAYVNNATDSKITFDTNSNTKPSYIKGMRRGQMMRRLVNKIADSKYGATPFSSDFLFNPFTKIVDSIPFLSIYSNAFHIKGIDDAIFKVKPQDVIDDLQSDYPCGLGVKNNVASIEHLSTFYRDDVVICEIPVLTDWEITPTADIGSTIILGNNYDETDTLNGTDDYNTKSTFKTAGKFSAEKEIDLSSNVITSVKSIEKQRVEEKGKDTTGNKINDKLFGYTIFNGVALGTGDYFLDYPNQSGGSVTGVFFPDWAYNVDRTPRRKAMMLAPLINSWTYPSVEPIKFLSSDRSATLISNFNGSVTVNEKSDIVPNSDCLWLPFSIKCKAVLPYNLPELMAANPYGVIVSKIIIGNKSVNVRIFVDVVSFKPSAMNDFEIEGRLSPTTPINEII